MVESKAIEQILAVTDFSETAKLGVDWAAALAARHGAKLTLFHALSPPVPLVLDVEFSLPEPDAYDLLSEAADVQMEALVEEVRGAGIEVEGRVEVARHLADVLQEVEEETGAELVVIGSRGLTAFRHLVMGGNAEEVIRRSSCPVLTVHPGDAVPKDGARRILVATDFSEDADQALRSARRLFSFGPRDTRFHLLHSVEVPTEWSFMVGEEVPPPSVRERIEERIMEEFGTRVAELRAEGFEANVKLCMGDPSEVIVMEAESSSTDLIVLGAHGHAALERIFLGSTATRVLHHAPCPVFTVRKR